MSSSSLLFAVLLVPLLVMPSGAQRLAPAALRASDGAGLAASQTAGTPGVMAGDPEPREIRKPSAVRTVGAGILGGAIGTVAGAMIGASAVQGCQGDLCGLQGALLGVLIGEPIGLAMGAHLGSGSARHERVLLTSLASAGVLVGGIAAGVGMAQLGGESAGSIMIPVIPVLQLVTALAIEGH